MIAKQKLPADFDDNPELDDDFFARAKPAAFGEAARLRAALAMIVTAHDEGDNLEAAIADARAALTAAQ